MNTVQYFREMYNMTDEPGLKYYDWVNTCGCWLWISWKADFEL